MLRASPAVKVTKNCIIDLTEQKYEKKFIEALFKEESINEIRLNDGGDLDFYSCHSFSGFGDQF